MISQMNPLWQKYTQHGWKLFYFGGSLYVDYRLEEPKLKSYTFNAFWVNFLTSKPSSKKNSQMFHYNFYIDPNFVFFHSKHEHSLTCSFLR